jgi:AAA15 family ATPase/GTPase
MKHFVITSSKESQKGDKINVEPFRLSSETESSPSEFEVIFIFRNVVYRYGFEADNKEIFSEWLFYKTKTKEVELFYRDANKFETHERNFSKGNAVIREGLVRDNALLLSVAAQFNDEISISVIEWFNESKVISGLTDNQYRNNIIEKIKSPFQKKRVIDLLAAADIGIEDLELLEINSGNFKEDPFLTVLTKKSKFLNKKREGLATFFLSIDESEGTKKYFYILGPILDSIDNGSMLVVDELDSKLHPNLVCKIVALFNSEELNKNNAQLIFNTHDTNLLSSGLFRRDQIWFTDKNKFGEAIIYSLADFKSDEVRKTESFEDNYLRGKYGAVPYLGFFDNLDNILPQYENEG